MMPMPRPTPIPIFLCCLGQVGCATALAFNLGQCCTGWSASLLRRGWRTPACEKSGTHTPTHPPRSPITPHLFSKLARKVKKGWVRVGKNVGRCGCWAGGWAGGWVGGVSVSFVWLFFGGPMKLATHTHFFSSLLFKIIQSHTNKKTNRTWNQPRILGFGVKQWPIDTWT